MAASIKESALEIAACLVELERALDPQRLEVTVAISASKDLHTKLHRAIYRHREALCLSREDVIEIENIGLVAFGGGTPKTPPDEGGG